MILLPRAVHNENDGLIAFLSQQVELLILCSWGLDNAQIRASIPESDLTLGGLLRHVAFVEKTWTDRIISAPESAERDNWDQEIRQQQFSESFVVNSDDTRESLIQSLREQTLATIQVITNTNLDIHIPLSPNFISAYPAGTTWSARWVVLHLIEEISRHGGHADIIREGIDGSTLPKLASAAEAEL